MKLKSLIAAAVLGIVSLSSQAAQYSFNIDYSGAYNVTGLGGGLMVTGWLGGLSNVQLDNSTTGITEMSAGNMYIFSLSTNDAHHTISFDAANPFTKSFSFTTQDASGHAVPSSLSGGGAIVTSVPEPETYAMMLAGMGALGFVGRRRKAK
jgi:hypothetical protein